MPFHFSLSGSLIVVCNVTATWLIYHRFSSAIILCVRVYKREAAAPPYNPTDRWRRRLHHRHYRISYGYENSFGKYRGPYRVTPSFFLSLSFAHKVSLSFAVSSVRHRHGRVPSATVIPSRGKGVQNRTRDFRTNLFFISCICWMRRRQRILHGDGVHPWGVIRLFLITDSIIRVLIKV